MLDVTYDEERPGCEGTSVAEGPEDICKICVLLEEVSLFVCVVLGVEHRASCLLGCIT